VIAETLTGLGRKSIFFGIRVHSWRISGAASLGN